MEGSRARILLIDDEQVILHAISRLLSDRHDVVCMPDAGMALAALTNGESFDLILCDMQMPGISGLDFYRSIEHHDPALATRVVFLTAGATTPEASALLTSMRTRYVEKPFAAHALRETIDKLLAGPKFRRSTPDKRST
jgi:CheY-like chemotaxis protein